MDTKMTEKAVIRREILKVRDNLPEDCRKKSEVLLTERILGHQWYYLSDTILCFASYGSEINTKPIWTEALRQGKRVYMPKILAAPEGEIMSFFRISGEEDLNPGYKGIPEPISEREEYSYTDNHSKKVLMLMPGVAFDPYRNRIGYGKGFYDRYLADKPKLQLRTIGIGFACQMVKQLPSRDLDIKPYQIICM